MRLWYIGLVCVPLCLIGLLIGFVVTRADVVTAELVDRPCDTIVDSRRGEVEGRFPIRCF